MRSFQLIHGRLALAGLALGLCVRLRGQDAAPAPARMDPAAVRRIAMPSCKTPQVAQMIVGKVFAREPFCILDGALNRFQAVPGEGQEVRAEALPPVEFGQGHFLKYDDGAYWIAERGGFVSKWDPVLKRWVVYAHVPGVWRDYEVLPNGKILLALTSDGPRQPLRALLEVYDPRSKAFDPVLEPPPGTHPSLSTPLEDLYYGSLRLFSVDEHVLIYGGWSGKLQVYDAMKNEVRDIAMPWGAFEFQDLLALFKKPDPRLTVVHPDATPEGPGEDVAYFIPSAPICCEFIPTQEGRVLMAYERMDPGSRERTPGLLEVDLDTLEATPRPVPSGGLHLPVWTDGNGRLVPLAEALHGAKPPAVPAGGPLRTASHH